jgi:hypothetical protein
MFTNGKQSLAHKRFMSLLKYLKSSEGVNWISAETRTYQHVVHRLLCKAHLLPVAVLKSRVKNNEDILIASANRVTATCSYLLQLWQQQSINPVSDFTIAPPTYKWFPIRTGQAVTNYKEQYHPGQRQPKQQKGGGGGTPAPTKTNEK